MSRWKNHRLANDHQHELKRRAEKEGLIWVAEPQVGNLQPSPLTQPEDFNTLS